VGALAFAETNLRSCKTPTVLWRNSLTDHVLH